MAQPLRFDFHTDPPLKGLSFATSRFGDGLEDLSGLFERFEEIFKAGQKEQFATQGDWGSGGWKDLSEAYAAWKAKHFPGRPIGYLHGYLRAGMTGGPGYEAEIGKDAASFGLGSGNALPYARYFAEERPVLAFPPQFARDLQKAAHRYLFEQAKAAFA